MNNDQDLHTHYQRHLHVNNGQGLHTKHSHSRDLHVNNEQGLHTELSHHDEHRPRSTYTALVNTDQDLHTQRLHHRDLQVSNEQVYIHSTRTTMNSDQGPHTQHSHYSHVHVNNVHGLHTQHSNHSIVHVNNVQGVHTQRSHHSPCAREPRAGCTYTDRNGTAADGYIRTNTNSFEQRPFKFQAMSVWNCIPFRTSLSDTLSSFNKTLITHLFRKAFCA